MKEKQNHDSGFTLIELVIAMAILAFLMASLSSFMGIGLKSYRKNKADIELQTSSMETFNMLNENLMAASDIVILGYEVPASMSIDFYADTNTTDLGAAKYFGTQTTEHKALYGNDITPFVDSNGAKKIIIEKIIIESSVVLDMTDVPNGMYNESEKKIKNMLKSAGSNEKFDEIEFKETQGVWSINDTVRTTYTFEGDKMYVEKEYAYMTTRNDVIDPAKKEQNICNDTVATTVDSQSTQISGCVVSIDSDSNNINIVMSFEDKHSEFVSNGTVNVRNTKVFK